MNRNIKFRGLTFEKEWVYGFFYEYAPGSYIRVPRPDGGYEDYAVIPETVTQFTGKKDCLDQDIYEDDIFYFDRDEWGGNGNVHVVSWNDQDAEWCWGGGTSSDMEWRTVIGNIFENPELL